MKTFFKTLVVAALTYEAKLLLRRHQPIIIAITGSVGKTSTKDAIYSVLKRHVSARKSEKSFNSDIGVPLTVLGLPNAWNNPLFWFKNLLDGLMIALFSKSYPSYLILETGVDRPGDMARLTAWLKPQMVVLTRLPDVPVHVEFFSSPEAVVAEKMKLVEALKSEGVLIYNHDDEIIKRQLPGVRQQAIGYSRYLPSQFMAREDKLYYHDNRPDGIIFDLEHIDQREEVRLPGALGTPPIYSALAAAAVGVQCGLSLKDVAMALSEHPAPPGRMRVMPGIKGSIIIDDTYNASPIAMEQALFTLKEVKYAKRRIAILGDMLALGKFSQREHERMGELVPQCADVLFTLGIRSRKIAEAALEHGLSEKNIFQYDDVARAGRELQAMLSPGDVVLVKASQGIRAERVVEEVMQEPERAKELLVRQDSEWQKR
jgi:UDP-N-acetylmuramyl pentapeptide synthase